MRLLRKSGITFGANLTSAGLNVVSGIILARVLGPSGKGTYVMVILIPTMMVMLGNMGIDTANIRFVGSKKYSLDDIVSNSFVSAIAFAVVLVLIVLAFHRPIGRSFLNGCDPRFLILSILAIPFLLVNRFFGAILLGQNRIVEFNILQIVQRAATTLGLVIFLFVLHSGVMAAILVWMVGIVTTSALAFLFTMRDARISLRPGYSVFTSIIRFGIKGHIANLSGFLNYRLDMFMVSFFAGAKNLGYYSIAVALSELVWHISDSVSRILAPQIAASNSAEANRITPVISRNILVWSTLAMLGLAISAGWIIKLIYGHEFLPAVAPLRFLAFGIICLSLDKVLSADLLGRGRIEIAMRASVMAVITNLLLNSFLIPKYGISGAAMASSVSYTVSACFVLFPYSRISGLSVDRILLVRPHDFKLYRIKR